MRDTKFKNAASKPVITERILSGLIKRRGLNTTETGARTIPGTAIKIFRSGLQIIVKWNDGTCDIISKEMALRLVRIEQVTEC